MDGDNAAGRAKVYDPEELQRKVLETTLLALELSKTMLRRKEAVWVEARRAPEQKEE